MYHLYGRKQLVYLLKVINDEAIDRHQNRWHIMYGLPAKMHILFTYTAQWPNIYLFVEFFKVNYLFTLKPPKKQSFCACKNILHQPINIGERSSIIAQLVACLLSVTEQGFKSQHH
jgi:hypothetical protein